MFERLRNNVPIWFAIKFLALFGLLYMANHVMTGLLVPGGYYSKWMDNNMNYVSALRHLLLQGGELIVNAAGYKTLLTEYTLRIQGYGGVRMVYSCIGINILCFWVAFVVAFPNNIKRKLQYSITGLIIINLLNISRVAILTLIHTNRSYNHINIDHHMIFNIVVYIFIFFMMMRMINSASKNVLRDKPNKG